MFHNMNEADLQNGSSNVGCSIAIGVGGGVASIASVISSIGGVAEVPGGGNAQKDGQGDDLLE